MPSCPNCLKTFKDALGVTRHLSQPLVSCRQPSTTTVELTTAAQVLNSLDRRASFESNRSSSHSQSSAHSGRLGTQSPHGFSMDLDLLPAWNPSPNSDEDDMVYHDEEADMDFLIPDGEALGDGAAGGHFMRFQGAARVHAWGLTFLERFNDDVYAHHHNNNLYYPFASFQDWELTSFLLSSMLSMAAIDRFLGIELVCFPSPTPDQLGF